MNTLFFAALTFFIFYKLSKQLGKIDESEKKQIEENLAKRRREIIELQNKIMTEAGQMRVVNPENKKTEEKILSSLDDNTKSLLTEIFEKSKISAEFFINGAKSAFEMIIKAFCSGDLDTLKFLLSEKIYQGFETAITQRKSQEKTLVTNLISFESVEIISAAILDNAASITVKFVSKQINYVTNKDGEIIEGRKDEINKLTDIWTFKRDITSSNPNWIVVSTNSN